MKRSVANRALLAMSVRILGLDSSIQASWTRRFHRAPAAAAAWARVMDISSSVLVSVRMSTSSPGFTAHRSLMILWAYLAASIFDQNGVPPAIDMVFS